MNNLKEYTRLKRGVEEDQQEADRAEGALAEIMKRLKDEFNCPTLAKAKKKLKQLKKQAEDLELEYDEEIESYKKKCEDESD
jgi:hypothetical protein